MNATITLVDDYYVVTRKEGESCGIVTAASRPDPQIFVTGKAGAESARALAVSLNLIADEIERTIAQEEEA